MLLAHKDSCINHNKTFKEKIPFLKVQNANVNKELWNIVSRKKVKLIRDFVEWEKKNKNVMTFIIMWGYMILCFKMSLEQNQQFKKYGTPSLKCMNLKV
jgi:hypothetical protein